MTSFPSDDVPHNRKGTGYLPPNPKQWDAENHGLDLRGELGVAPEDVLRHEAAFALLPNVRLFAHGELYAPAEGIDFFRGLGRPLWSGFALPVVGLGVVVVFNDAHPITRTRATLMEEFFHLRLDHPPSAVRLLGAGGPPRTHDLAIEAEAYACGAAALVPYKPLKAMHTTGMSPARIGEHFEVSSQLIDFRLRVTRIVRRARRAG